MAAKIEDSGVGLHAPRTKTLKLVPVARIPLESESEALLPISHPKSLEPELNLSFSKSHPKPLEPEPNLSLPKSHLKPVGPESIGKLGRPQLKPFDPNQMAIIITHTPASSSGEPSILTAEEREAERLERDRIKSARRYNKIKAYRKLAYLPTNKERFKHLALICYPHLAQWDPNKLDRIIGDFVDQLERLSALAEARKREALAATSSNPDVA